MSWLMFQSGSRYATTKRVMAATGLPKDEVQNDLCRAIADRVIDFQGKLKKHTTRPMRSSDVLEGRAFEIPTTIKPEDMDWDRSRPKDAWLVRRGAYDPAGYWELERIELSRTDVTNALCTAEQQRMIEYAPSEDGAKSRSQPAPAGNPVGHDPGAHAPQSPATSGSARRRGVRPKKFAQASGAMRDDIQQGRRTVEQLKSMFEKDLAGSYGVSRDTARKARNAVLSEFGEN
jgi:hypothetical protein